MFSPFEFMVNAFYLFVGAIIVFLSALLIWGTIEGIKQAVRKQRAQENDKHE